MAEPTPQRIAELKALNDAALSNAARSVSEFMVPRKPHLQGGPVAVAPPVTSDPEELAEIEEYERRKALGMAKAPTVVGPAATTGSGTRKPIGSDTLSGVMDTDRKEIGDLVDRMRGEQLGLGQDAAQAAGAVADEGRQMVSEELTQARHDEIDAETQATNMGNRVKAAQAKANVSSKMKSEAARTGIDPSRYMKNMKNTTRAGNMIAIALEGIGKAFIRLGGGQVESGSQVLKMINASIEADIQAQRDNITNLMKSAGYDESALRAVRGAHEKSIANHRGTLERVMKLRLYDMAYAEEDPKNRKWLMGVAGGLDKAAVNVKLQTATRFKNKRLVYKNAPRGTVPGSGSKGGGRLKSMVLAKRVTGKGGKFDFDATMDQHKQLNAAAVKAYKDGKSPLLAVPTILQRAKGGQMKVYMSGFGRFKAFGKNHRFGFPGKEYNAANFSQPTASEREKFAEFMQGADSSVKFFNQNNVNNKTWDAWGKIWTSISPSDKRSLQKAMMGVIAIKRAVQFSGGRATEPENAASLKSLASAFDSANAAKAKIDQLFFQAENSIKLEIRNGNWQLRDPSHVIGAYIKLQRMKRAWSGKGGTAKPLKTREGG